MSTLTGQRIKDTYDGLLKTEDSTQGIPATGKTLIEDGLGNDSALSLGRADNGADITGNLEVTGNVKSDNINTDQTEQNTFIGENTGNLASTDPLKIQNTAVGTNALASTTVGSLNVAIGDNSMLNSTTGNSNVAIGSGSLKSCTSASFNTAIGRDAMENNINGNNNTAIGINALKSSVAASYNIAVGANTMQNHTQGASNVAVGRDCLQFQTQGTGNIAIGQRCLQNNQTSNQIAIGTSALQQSVTIGRNIAIGRSSQRAATGYNNTTLGFQAGQTLTGNNNILIGVNSNPSAQAVSNEITLGNGGHSVLRCAVTSITSLSDERDKTDIKPLEYGLDFIQKLEPKQFVWDNRPEIITEYDEDDNEIEVEFENENKGKKDFGFIAQEVQELDDDVLRLVYSENPEKLEMSYGKLVPILVKAIQELKTEIDVLKNK